MDAITLLREDHRELKRMFKQFEKTSDPSQRRQIVDEMIRELSRHSAAEETVFYPAIRQELGELDSLVLEGLEEHHLVKLTLAELDGMDPTHERFEAKVTVMIESVSHHVQEEEEELFPKVRKAFGRKRLADLGETMEQAKKVAPTRPHPHQPDEPPGNLVGGLASAVLDRTRDAVRGAGSKAAGKARGAAKDGGTSAGAKSKGGSSDGADGAAGGAKSAAGSAKSTAKSAAGNGAAKPAKKSAKAGAKS